MSAYSNSSSKHFRAASFQQDSSAYSAAAPNDEFYNQNVGHVKRYLSKFDDLSEKTNSASKPQDSRTFSAQKNINDSSYSEIDIKSKENEDFTVKSDMSRRISNLENKLQEMTQKVTREVPRQEDVGRVNDRVSGLERRMDTMDRKLERLTTTLETFMQKFQGQLAPQEELLTAPDEKRSSLSYGNSRKEIPHETGERLTEIKLLGNNAIKNIEPEREAEQKSYVNAGHRRTQSRDGLDTRERVREALDQARKKDDLALQDRGRINMVEPKIFTVEQFERNKLVAKTQDKALERFGTRESPEPKNAVPKQLKGSLRSPDTARKRKNVSWSENCVSEGNLEEEIGQKRNRMDTSDIGDYGRYGFEQKSEVLRVDENKYKPSNVRAYGGKEEENYEKQMKYISGEARTEKIKSEVEKLEEKLRKIERSENVNEKERQLEEKRRKIDEEIQRRIDRQNEARKRGDGSEVGQRRIGQFEDDLKTNSCNDISNYKDMGSRNELISKYSDITSSAAKRCKNA